MDDLSRVVNFSALYREVVGNDGNASFDFRGPRALDFEASFVELTAVEAACELCIEGTTSAVF